MSVETTGLTADIDIDCPRCGKATTERLFGPCEACRVELRASMAGKQTEVEAAEYEPKMNVVPNAVASKE